VRAGVLAGTLPEDFFQRVARRGALNVQRILLGDEAGELPVDYPATSRLTINMATARAIGIEPNWKVLTEALLIEDDANLPAQTWTLSSAARQAVNTNLEMRVQDQIVLAGEQDPKIANSVRLPQVGAGLGASFYDYSTARSTDGLVPERSLVGSLNLQQVVWDDRTWAGVDIQNSLQEVRVLDRDSIRLDITLESSVGYLEVLRAKTLSRILRENLNLTRNNLEVARVRVDTGIATRQEIFRWENQIATSRRSVVDVQALVRIEELLLNRVLNRPLEEPFGTEDVGLDDSSLLTDPQGFYAFIENPKDFKTLRDFLALEAMKVSPELQAIDAATRAQTRVLTATDRAFWSPTVSVDAGLRGFFLRSELDSIDGGALATTNEDDLGSVNWNFGVNLTYPIFEGTARTAEQDKAGEELSRLNFERSLVAQRIDTDVRVAMLAAQASYAGIELSNDAAEAARANYGLVAIQYQRGTATILDLLDAQNISVTANEDAADALYRFLIDIVRVQRAVGRFEFSMSAAERDAFLDRLEEYTRQARAESALQ
jgi:outer membrane protein